MILSRFDRVAHGPGHIGVGHALLETGSHAQYEVDMLIGLALKRQFILNCPIMVVDAGANVGSHTVSIAKAIDGKGEVVAIEAQARLFYALAGNIALNNLFNAHAIHAAVSDSIGTISGPTVDYQVDGHFGGLSILPQHNGHIGQNVSYRCKIVTTTIDGLNLPRLDLLKLDIEGMEPQAMRGAVQSIEKYQPIIYAETILCGLSEFRKTLPENYKSIPLGEYALAMPQTDPMWSQLDIADAA